MEYPFFKLRDPTKKIIDLKKASRFEYFHYCWVAPTKKKKEKENLQIGL